MLDLPYEGDELSMVVLLPKEREGLAKVENILTVENLENWIVEFDNGAVVSVLIPKNKILQPFDNRDIAIPKARKILEKSPSSDVRAKSNGNVLNAYTVFD